MRLLLLVAVLIACGCVPPPAAPEEGPPVPQVTLQGVRLKYFKGGELIASGTARELTYQRSTSEFVASDVKLLLPARPGAPRTSAASGQVDLFAPLARGTLGNRQAEGEGGVVVRTGSGLVGRTARAAFDGQASSAQGSDEVRVEGKDYRLSSRGFSIDFPAERFSFGAPVNTRFGGDR